MDIIYGLFNFYIFLAIVMAVYIFGSAGIYLIGKRRGEKWLELSFIPVINNLIISKLAFNNYLVGIVMIILFIGDFLFTGSKVTINRDLFFELDPFNISIMILDFICTYKIYRQYTHKYLILFVISMLTFGLATPFIYFYLRNKETIRI